MSASGITQTQAEIAMRLGITVKYVDEFMRGHGMGIGKITSVNKHKATIQPLSNKVQPFLVPLSRIKITSADMPAVTAEFNRIVAAKPEETAMPPEVAPRPIKAEPISQPVGDGGFMAIAARMELSAKRVEEREKDVQSARDELKAAESMLDEAEKSLKDAKKDLERLGTEFSSRYTGLMSRAN